MNGQLRIILSILRMMHLPRQNMSCIKGVFQALPIFDYDVIGDRAIADLCIAERLISNYCSLNKVTNLLAE